MASSSTHPSSKGNARMQDRTPPTYAKAVAAATGSTMTALTMTPFDVIKTRLQTQPSAGPPPLFPRPPLVSHGAPSTGLTTACCRPSPLPCVRNISSLALASPYHASALLQASRTTTICLWDGAWRTERVSGVGDAAVKVWKAEGVRGLWKGVGTTLVIALPASTAYMLTYDYLLHTLPVHPSATVLTPLVAGVTARSLLTSLLSPLELVRTRLQSTPANPGIPHTLKSVLSGVKIMVHKDGVRSLWRGLGSTLWRDVPFSGVYWAGYETGKGWLRSRGHEGAGASFVSGAVSGMTAALLTSPFDTLKTRKQAITSSDSINMRTIPLLRQILRVEGPRALFAGLSPRIAKIAPACGIMISCFEGVSRMIDPGVDEEQ